MLCVVWTPIRTFLNKSPSCLRNILIKYSFRFHISVYLFIMRHLRSLFWKEMSWELASETQIRVQLVALTIGSLKMHEGSSNIFCGTIQICTIMNQKSEKHASIGKKSGPFCRLKHSLSTLKKYSWTYNSLAYVTFQGSIFCLRNLRKRSRWTILPINRQSVIGKNPYFFFFSGCIHCWNLRRVWCP